MKAGTLWRNHGRAGLTQAERLLRLLREARREDRSVLLPEIMALGIAQHGARILELRGHGFVIDNELCRSANGVTVSRYWLRFDPEQESIVGTERDEGSLARSFPEFGDFTMQRRHRDDG